MLKVVLIASAGRRTLHRNETGSGSISGSLAGVRRMGQQVEEASDGQGGAAFVVVVDIDVGVDVHLQTLPDDLAHGAKPIVFGRDDLIPCAARLLLAAGSVGAVEANDRDRCAVKRRTSRRATRLS